MPRPSPVRIGLLSLLLGAGALAGAAQEPLVDRVVERLRQEFDPETATFRDSAPSLPHGILRFLLSDRVGATAPASVPLAAATLEALARGGIRDQIGGGFHHASAGPGWRVPRFEKRLADNALLLRAYALGYAATGRLLFRDVARETSAWAIRELRDSTGTFWAGLGA